MFVSRKNAVFCSQNAVKLSISHHLRTYPSFIGVLIFALPNNTRHHHHLQLNAEKMGKQGSK